MPIKFMFMTTLLLALLLVGCQSAEAPEVTTETQATEAKMETTAEVKIEEAKAPYKKIKAEEAKSRLDASSDIILVDVRTQEEFDSGHIEGALLIPYDEMADLSASLLPDKDAEIFLYCRSGNRSGIAGQELIALGYTNIVDFGGIIDWPYDIVK
jgi:phage shock protein E